MGRTIKRYSISNVPSHDSKLNKYKKYMSTSCLEQTISKKDKRIRNNFRSMIRRLMSKQSQNKETHIVSFLNIMASVEDICSLVCMPGIPSIENMMSHHLINPMQQLASQLQSNYTCTQPLSSELLTTEPQLPVYFICLLEKVLKLISLPLTKKQNQAIIKGTWNILIKYWKDNGHLLYKVNEKVEWGLLELLGFKFTTGKKQRFQAQQRLRITLLEIENEISQHEISQRSWGCTLQLIQ